MSLHKTPWDCILLPIYLGNVQVFYNRYKYNVSKHSILNDNITRVTANVWVHAISRYYA